MAEVDQIREEAFADVQAQIREALADPECPENMRPGLTLARLMVEGRMLVYSPG